MGSTPSTKDENLSPLSPSPTLPLSPSPTPSPPLSPSPTLPLSRSTQWGAAMIGQLLDRRYRIIKVLGSNAFGNTYLAADTHRPGYPQCVVKQLRSPSQQPRAIQIIQVLFKKKAETLEKLAKHDQIPQLLAFFEENKEFYIVEEFIPGQSLASEMVPGVPMSEEQALRLLQEILEILAFAHQQEAIHGHLKPVNIIRRQSDGKLVLIEFGAVKKIGSQANSAVSLSSISSYRPSEQLEGHLFYNSDLYGLGIIAIQALTGISEEELAKLQVPNQTAKGEIAWQSLAQVSPELAAIIDKMVRYDYSERYQSAEEVLADLKKIREEPERPAPTILTAEQNSQKLRLPLAVASHWQGLRTSPMLRNLPIWAGIAAVMVAGAFFLSLLPRDWERAGDLSRGDREAIASDLRKGAIADYNLTLNLNPNNAEAYYKRGNAKYDRGDYRAAIADYTQAIRLQSNNANAYFNRGLAYYALKEHQAAVEDYLLALKLNPNDSDAYSKRARAYVGLANYPEAIADYTRAIQLNSDDTKAYIERGRARLAAEDRAGAIADYNQAIRINPNDEDAYSSRGQARALLADYPSAIEDFAVAIRINPTSVEAYKNRCSAYLNLGDYQKAVADCTSAIAISAKDAAAYNDRCFAQFNLGEYQKAIEDCTTALAIDPDRAKAYSNRGRSRAAADDKSGAIEDYTKAIRIDPSDAVAYGDRAAAQLGLGNYGEAIEDYTRAIRLQPDYDGAYSGRGSLRAQMGDKPGAIEDFQKTSKLCLDRGNTTCYNDAQSQVRKLQP